jgi:hypothetical protein
VRHYHTDPRSSFHNLRFRTRENYESNLRRIERDLGNEKIADIDQERAQQAFDKWAEGGRGPIAHSLMGMLRMLATFGAKFLQSRDCRELKLTLHEAKFQRGSRPRKERLTFEQAVRFRMTAHRMGYASLALAQAIQFDCALRQKDVIGEWVPVSEPGESKLEHDGLKWLHGIVWSEIDDASVLRHVTSFNGELVKVKLSDAPMVQAEFEQIRSQFGSLPQSGPVIVSEVSGVPYVTHQFRYRWRQVADAAGIPKSVYNMDSRGD